MIRKYLQLTFKNQEGGNFTLSVYDPKEDVTEAEVESVMDTILDQNAFSTNGGELASKNSARIVTRQIDTLAEF